MTQNPPHQPLSSAVTTAANGCFACKSDDHWIVHNVKVRDDECRKYCTSCVLKLYPTSFCPACYNLHDPNSLHPPPLPSSSSSSSSSRTITCFKCSKVSHITCVPANTPKSPYLCPPCSVPNFRYFSLKKSRKNRDQPPTDSGGEGEPSQSKKVPEEKVLDERAARALLLAAKMSAISINRAVAAARNDVDRKVKEAALARKRAKEAIDHVMGLSSKLSAIRQQQRRDVLVPGQQRQQQQQQVGPSVKVERNGGVHNVGVPGNGNRNGNGSMTLVPVVSRQQSNGVVSEMES